MTVATRPYVHHRADLPLTTPHEHDLTTLGVNCPTCHERLLVTLTADPQTVECVYCKAPVEVPSQAQAIAARDRVALPTPETVGSYDLISEARSSEAKRSAAPPRGAGSKTSKTAPERNEISLECHVCHELLRVTPGTKPGRVKCPMCESQVPVPSRDEVARRKIRAIAPRPKEEIGEYGVGAAPLPPPRPRTRLFDRLAEVRQEEIPPPPKWTFFSGVFEFPFRRDVIVRWGFMTGGFLAMALVGYLMLSLARSASSYTGGAVIAFFALPLIWLTFWTCSHAADCCLRVLESTAGGLDRVESWPEPNWRDWMVQLIYLLWLAAVTTVCSYGIAKLAELQGVPLAPVLLASFFTLFPIVLLSSLEAASPWVPLTLPILKSMYRLWWGWLIFYAETGLIVAALAGYVLYVFPQAELLSMLFFGPLLAAALLIYARLLGRLAWRAIEAM